MYCTQCGIKQTDEAKFCHACGATHLDQSIIKNDANTSTPSLIKGAEHLSDDVIIHELKNGAKLVMFQYCISIFILTFRRSSDIIFIKKDESVIFRGLPYIFISLILGWWGIPWGPIYTIGSVITNLSGGKDVTKEFMELIGESDALDVS